MKKYYLIQALVALLCFINYTSSFSQNSKLWGMTMKGGLYDSGTIFSTDANGDNYLIEHSFKLYEGSGAIHSKLCKDLNGKLYGMTSLGGQNNKGVIFEYDEATDTYTKKFDFDGATNGSTPLGSLLLANNGKMYGLTSIGGAFDKGVIFEFIPSSGIVTKLFDFDGLQDGGKPYSSLIQASNGKLYGVTSMSFYTGYANTTNTGVLFEFDINTGVYLAKKGVSGNPYGSPVQVNNGKLYFSTALTISGGGGIYKYDILNDFLMVKFQRLNWKSYGSLLQSGINKLIGMAYSNGTSGNGEIFELDLSTSIYTVKNEFDYYLRPYGDLIQASNGKFYGTTSNLSINSGVLFEYDLGNNTFIVRKIFDARGKSKGSLTEVNGKLYGMTFTQNEILFEYNLSTTTFSKKFMFNVGREGAEANGSLIKANNGKLYGMTSVGGLNNLGVIFEFDSANNTLTKKFDFDTTNGAYPKGSLLQASNNKLYGMTSAGGVIPSGMSGGGVLFEFDLGTNLFVKRHDFVQDDGYNPFGSLIQATNGKLYGMTSNGGSTGYYGSIFEYDTSANTFTKKSSFLDVNSGQHPNGDLLQASNGNLYGVTQDGGGTQYAGVLFEYNIGTNTYTNKHRFTNSSNQSPIYPQRNVIQASNGKLYGVTKVGGGGQSGSGIIFEWDINTSVFVTPVFAFSTTGLDKGSVMQSSNGNLYGFTQGTFSSGKLYELTLPTYTYNTKASNSSFEGSGLCGNLIEIPNSNLAINNTDFKSTTKLYPNPTTGVLNIVFDHTYSSCKIQIVNLRGQIVFSDDYNYLSSTQLNVSGLKGIYILHLTIDNLKTEIFKVIKN